MKVVIRKGSNISYIPTTEMGELESRISMKNRRLANGSIGFTQEELGLNR
jgi:hypothetical protein